MVHLADSLRESSFFPMGFAIQLFVQFIHTQYLYKYHEITSNKERWISVMLQENCSIKYRQEKCNYIRYCKQKYNLGRKVRRRNKSSPPPFNPVLLGWFDFWRIITSKNPRIPSTPRDSVKAYRANVPVSPL